MRIQTCWRFLLVAVAITSCYPRGGAVSCLQIASWNANVRRGNKCTSAGGNDRNRALATPVSPCPQAKRTALRAEQPQPQAQPRQWFNLRQQNQQVGSGVGSHATHLARPAQLDADSQPEQHLAAGLPPKASSRAHRESTKHAFNLQMPKTVAFRKMATSMLLMVSILCAPAMKITLGTQAAPPENDRMSILARSPRLVTNSVALALTEQQWLVDDVWKEVNRQFVDPTFNGLGEERWKSKRTEAMKKVANIGPDDKEEVYSVIRSMLEPLGDPYTRFLTPSQFDSLTAYAKGTSTGGIGVQLMSDPLTGKVLILNTILDGPAAKAGVVPGDIVEEINGEDMTGATSDVVAAKCRGEIGTDLTLAIGRRDADAHRLSSSSGSKNSDGSTRTQDHQAETIRVSVTRATIRSNQIAGQIVSTRMGNAIGVIRITSFNQNTANQVMAAVAEVRKGSTAVVLDLRGNAGGYMPAGVDVAKLFLPPRARIISEVDKTGRSAIYINDGVGSDADIPLYVVVDKRTASASEILTAALQDNQRATVVGYKTFGKGRIQNVQPLEDGSGIAVTKAKYITPNGRDIHGVGIVPDRPPTASCGPQDNVVLCLDGII